MCPPFSVSVYRYCMTVQFFNVYITESTTFHPFTVNSEANTTTDVISELDNPTSLRTISKLECVGGTYNDSQCAIIALRTGVVSVIVTGLLVASISVAIHIAVYHCVYKTKLRSSAEISGSGLKDDVNGCGDAIVYDVVNERVQTALEMNQNEAYGLTRAT